MLQRSQFRGNRAGYLGPVGIHVLRMWPVYGVLEERTLDGVIVFHVKFAQAGELGQYGRKKSRQAVGGTVKVLCYCCCCCCNERKDEMKAWNVVSCHLKKSPCHELSWSAIRYCIACTPAMLGNDTMIYLVSQDCQLRNLESK